MDFINLWPHDISDLVFQHLNGKEILKATLVSNEWNQFLSRSSVLKKIVINPRINVNDLSYLLNSTRKYRNIYTENASRVSKEIIEIIANPHHKFNSIHISQTEFRLEKDIELIFLNSCLTLEKLTLICISFENQEEDPLASVYDFPNLRELNLVYNPRYHQSSINKYFASFTNLKSLYLINGCDEHFKNLIMKSKNLKKLEIAGYFYDTNFFKDLSLMPSIIEEFIFNNILSSSKDDENLRYFNDFFTSQSNTLKRFETDALIEPDEINNAFKMKNLVELSVKGFHYNVDLMRIHLDNIRLDQSSITPSCLVRFNVHYMDDILLELLAINAQNLKELIVRRFEPTDVSNPSWFPKLQVIFIRYFNVELKDKIVRKSFDERTRLERMVLEAVIESTNDI